MTLFPELPVDFSTLNEIVLQPIRSRLLRTGIELKIFDHLILPMTAVEIARSTGTHPDNTAHLLDGLTAMGLLEKRGGKYRNGDIAQTFLVSGSDTYLGGLIDAYQRTLVDVLENTTEVVRRGPSHPPDHGALTDSQDPDIYASVLANTARGGYAQIISRIVRELPESSGMRRMLDIGGGPGIIAMAILDDHPTMIGVVFEQPGMAEAARRYIDAYQMEGRLKVLEGDFLLDDIDGGYDLILTSFCLYFGKHCIDSIVTKIYEALEPGGVYISIHEGLTHEGTKPEILVLPQMGCNMMGRPIAFQWGEIAGSMKRCGFSSVESRMERTPFGEVELVLGRK
jgi:SAM-dependent methyltransferase